MHHFGLLEDILKRDFSSAGSELEELLSNKNFPKKMEKDLALITSDFYVRKRTLQQRLLSC